MGYTSKENVKTLPGNSFPAMLRNFSVSDARKMLPKNVTVAEEQMTTIRTKYGV